MKNIKQLFIIILFKCSLFSNFNFASDKEIRLDSEEYLSKHEVTASNNHSTLENNIKFIRLITEEQDIELLKNLCKAHAEFHLNNKLQNFSGLELTDIIEKIKVHNTNENCFGIYGFYQRRNQVNKELVGIIKMIGFSPTVDGYAECEMTMHPDYRGQGLGYIFREMFHDQVVHLTLESHFIIITKKKNLLGKFF